MPEATAPDVYRAIAYVMKEIGKDGIGKGRKNQQQGYAFRGIDEVLNALNPILSDAALCILPRMVSRIQDERSTKNGGVLFYVIVQGEFDFVSARDGSRHTVVTFGEGMDSADKATNKAMSAALKYACFQTFMIPTEGMDDADATTPAPVPKPQPLAMPAPQQPESRLPQRPVPPAPSGITLANTAPLPWKDRPTMEAAFEDVRATVGDHHYLYILQTHDITPGLKGTIGKLKAAYSTLRQRAAEIATGETEGASV